MNAKQWYVGNAAGGHHKTICDESDPSGRDVALVYEPDGTAEFMVRAINAYDELVSALLMVADDPLMEAMSGDTVAAVRAAVSKAEAA